MNTDASNVEDINILHITECLSLSFVASFEDWFRLFHTWSPCARMIWILTTFLILLRCKSRVHIIVINDKPVSVLSERTGWLSTHGTHRSWLLLIPRAQRYLTFMSGFHRLSDAAEGRTSGVISLHRETKFIIGFDFAVTLSSTESSCVLSGITSEQSVELKWLTLNKHKRWFHSSRVKFPLVKMSASWFLVSMYLIWILGSKLIRSNNQSRATLWVLETCLIVGLLPLIIILINASLSSKIFNKASWREDWTFEEIKSTLSRSLITPWDCFRFWIVWGVEQTSRWFNNGSPLSFRFWSCFQELQRSDPINQEREYHLTSILHPKKWYLTLLNCVKLKFVSYTSNWLEQTCDFPKRIMFHQKWISNLQDLLRCQSLETVPACIVWQYYPHNKTVCIHMYSVVIL